MECKHKDCLYNTKNKCTAKQVSINYLGICETLRLPPEIEARLAQIRKAVMKKYFEEETEKI